jgi:SAM-dependent methyltransferase
MSGSQASPDAWAQASEGFRIAVEQYFQKRGVDPAAANVQSTVRTNTDLVPRRAEIITQLLEALTPGTTLTDARVLEAGSGFGALAAYLAWRYETNEVVAIDVREDYVDSARDSAHTLGLGDRLRFEVGDMRDFAGVGDEWADVVIMNNAFIYLSTAREMKCSLDALHRITVPGGVVLLYHANKWTLREPFTKDPIVHLLPRPIARGVSALTGWRHNHGRVRFVSPPEMRRRLRRARFEEVKVAGWRDSELNTGRRAYGARYYGRCARRRG